MHTILAGILQRGVMEVAQSLFHLRCQVKMGG